jgi:hypothetical protein
MKKVNFKHGLIALAIGLVMVSCGGNASKKQSADGTTATEKTETKVPDSKSGDGWTSNEYLKQIPKPDFTIHSDEVDISDRQAFVRFSATKEQVTAYWEKVKVAGFTKKTMNSDGKDMLGEYSFSASNEAGYRVELTGNSSRKSGALKIGKQRADGLGIE